MSLMNLTQKNKSVMALIRGEVFPQCSLMLTSRPHSAADIETDFENILRIEGFTQKHMQEFCSKLLKGEEKAKVVFSPFTRTIFFRVPHCMPVRCSFSSYVFWLRMIQTWV